MSSISDQKAVNGVATTAARSARRGLFGAIKRALTRSSRKASWRCGAAHCAACGARATAPQRASRRCATASDRESVSIFRDAENRRGDGGAGGARGACKARGASAKIDLEPQ